MSNPQISSSKRPTMRVSTTFALISAGLMVHAAMAGPSCQATSGINAPTVVELYTSEGCSSCPPADKWLSTLKGKPDVLALAFHVNYWDRLGWVDRFASPEATSRQYELARVAGSSQVYTPQVVVGGRDWRQWPRLPASHSSSTPAAGQAPSITLARDGDVVTAQINAATGSNARLAGYWAVLEDQHESKVRAGENSGETLRHDHVVRLYKPVTAWAASSAQQLQLQVTRGEPAYPRRVVFVVTDPATAKPIQAASLSC
jgi:hypothetical protein